MIVLGEHTVLHTLF